MKGQIPRAMVWAWLAVFLTALATGMPALTVAQEPPVAETFPFDADQPALGRWLGTVDHGQGRISSVELRLTHEDGKWGGKFSAPNGGIFWADLTAVTAEGSRVEFSFTFRQITYTFAGTISSDGQEISGRFKSSREDPDQPDGSPSAFRRVPYLSEMRPNAHYTGHIELPNMKLAIALHLGQTAGGTWHGSLDVIAQNLYDLHLTDIRIGGENNAVELTLPIGFEVKFVGTMTADGTKIEGQYTQAGQSFPFVLEKQAGETKTGRPQTPEPPFPYRTIDVTFKNEIGGGHDLAGTLTVPLAPGKYPAVVLITGSGPQDRDESLMGHKPFLVIADHLTRNGFAVLRYDDRGVGQSGGQFAGATTADLATDVQAAVKFLLARDEIDGAKIGLMGHSEGGLIAPIVAAAMPDEVAFIVLLAGPGVPGTEIIIAQAELIGRVSGTDEGTLQCTKIMQRRVYELAAKTDLPDAEFQAAVLDVVKEFFTGLSDEERAQAGSPEDAAAALAVQLREPWFNYFLRFDPRPTLRQVKCPVLAVNGTLDLQVPWDQNLPEIWKALTEGGNQDVTIRAFPRMNHLFQNSTTGSPNEYAQIDITFEPDALAYVTDWLHARTR